MRAFSLSPPIRRPFASPMTAATPTAVRIAVPTPAWLPTPTMITAASENVPGVLRSMPPVMITSIWPRAVIPRRAPYGAMARRADPPRVAGAQIEATITSSARATNTGM
jgi:hypothetical protein